MGKLEHANIILYYLTHKHMKSRPLSPHLTAYKFKINSTMSILHRITGVGMFFGMMIVAWYFNFRVLAGSCKCWDSVAKMMLGLVGLGLCYHISTGIRHLIWDFGHFMSKEEIKTTGYVCIAFSVALACILFLL